MGREVIKNPTYETTSMSLWPALRCETPQAFKGAGQMPVDLWGSLLGPGSPTIPLGRKCGHHELSTQLTSCAYGLLPHPLAGMKPNPVFYY